MIASVTARLDRQRRRRHTGWASHVPFYLKARQRPYLIRLNSGGFEPGASNRFAFPIVRGR